MTSQNKSRAIPKYSPWHPTACPCPGAAIPLPKLLRHRAQPPAAPSQIGLMLPKAQGGPASSPPPPPICSRHIFFPSDPIQPITPGAATGPGTALGPAQPSEASLPPPQSQQVPPGLSKLEFLQISATPAPQRAAQRRADAEQSPAPAARLPHYPVSQLILQHLWGVLK